METQQSDSLNQTFTTVRKTHFTPHITDSGTTVLGRYPGYIEKAEKMEASYFDIGKEWDEVASILTLGN